MANRVILSPEYFPDPTRSRAISGGFIYVGIVDLDPKIEANQKQISVLQENGTTVEVVQPIETNSGGTPQYNGSPVTILVDGPYSLRVDDKHGEQAYYVPSNTENSGDTVKTIEELRELTGAFQDQSVDVLGYYTAGDGGGGLPRIWNAGAGQVDTGGNVIVPGGTVGSVSTLGAWVFNTTQFNPRDFGAKGDGSNDTAAFVAMFTNQAEYISYYVPAGFYVLDPDLLRISESNISLVGDGQGASTLSFTGTTGDGIVIEPDDKTDPSGSFMFSITIKDIGIVKNNNSTLGCGIRFTKVKEIAMTDVTFTDWHQALEVLGCQNNSFVGLKVNSGRLKTAVTTGSFALHFGPVIYSDLTGFQGFSSRVVNSRFTGNAAFLATQDGVLIESGEVFWFVNCQFSLFDRNHVRVRPYDVDYNVNNLSFTQVYFDGVNFSTDMTCVSATDTGLVGPTFNNWSFINCSFGQALKGIEFKNDNLALNFTIDSKFFNIQDRSISLIGENINAKINSSFDKVSSVSLAPPVIINGVNEVAISSAFFETNGQTPIFAQDVNYISTVNSTYSKGPVLSAGTGILNGEYSGTFTPVLTAGGITTGITITSVNGDFRKDGDSVSFNIFIEATLSGATGPLIIGSMPFEKGTGPAAVTAILNIDDNTIIQGYGKIDAGTKNLRLRKITSTGTLEDINVADVLSPLSITVSGVYFTDL